MQQLKTELSNLSTSNLLKLKLDKNKSKEEKDLLFDEIQKRRNTFSKSKNIKLYALRDRDTGRLMQWDINPSQKEFYLTVGYGFIYRVWTHWSKDVAINVSKNPGSKHCCDYDNPSHLFRGKLDVVEFDIESKIVEGVND